MSRHERPANQVSRVQSVLLIAALLGCCQVISAEESMSITALEEVRVTAQRREQGLMEVPLAVTVFTGDDLWRMGAPDLVYLGQFSPNTTLEPTPGTNTTLTAYIRGVGQQDINAGFEPGVGVYIDDVYLNRPQAAILDIYDVERIEILRGPQGTLYGRNTIGGAIRYITRPLGDEPYTNTRLSYGSFNQLDLVLSASRPVAEQLRLGGSLAWFQRDGFGENLYLGLDNYTRESFAARFSAEWDFNDYLVLSLKADYLDDESGARHGRRMVPGRLSGAPVLDEVFNTRAGLNNPEPSVAATGFSLTADWDSGSFWQLKNILAYREDETWAAWDFDSLPSADFDLPQYFKNRQFSEELQLSMSGRNWNGLVGFYWLEANAFQNYDVLLANTGEIVGLPGLNAFTQGDVDTRSWALFTDFSWRFSEYWGVDLGVRYTRDRRRSAVLRQTKVGGTSSVFGGSAIAIATTSDFQGEQTFDAITPRVVLNWLPNDHQTFYASYSEGFKGGGFDPRGQTSMAPDLDGDGYVDDAEVFEFMSFAPETVDAVELGLKSWLLSGRVSSRLALFWSDYSDVQIPGSLAVDSNGDGIDDQFVGTTTNAASADISGVEWEGQALLAEDFGRPGSQLRLGWALGYLDAEFNEFIDFRGIDVADIYQFRNSPERTASGMLSLDWPIQLFRHGGSLLVFTSLAYRDDTVQFEQPTPELNQPAYTLWDLSVEWASKSGRWSLGIHGKNLTDEAYIVAGFYAPTLGQEGNITAFYGNPRQVWATLQYRIH